MNDLADAPRTSTSCEWTISKAVEIALSCREMYGRIPITAITVTSPATSALFPYRDAMKSASEVIRWTLLMRIIFRRRIHQSTHMSVGPM